jgi:hypothetical protein
MENYRYIELELTYTYIYSYIYVDTDIKFLNNTWVDPMFKNYR